jgi:hypothetical protein
VVAEQVVLKTLLELRDLLIQAEGEEDRVTFSQLVKQVAPVAQASSLYVTPELKC